MFEDTITQNYSLWAVFCFFLFCAHTDNCFQMKKKSTPNKVVVVDKNSKNNNDDDAQQQQQFAVFAAKLANNSCEFFFVFVFPCGFLLLLIFVILYVVDNWSTCAPVRALQCSRTCKRTRARARRSLVLTRDFVALSSSLHDAALRRGGVARHLFAIVAHALVVSLELEVRMKTLRVLQQYLGARDIDFNDMLKIWKGLFYCFWMSDKMIVQVKTKKIKQRIVRLFVCCCCVWINVMRVCSQEELATNLAQLIHSCASVQSALDFVAAFYSTMIREWPLLDRIRLDK